MFSLMRPIVLIMQASLAWEPRATQAPAQADSMVLARIDSATRAFQTSWRYAWQESQQEQPTLFGARSKDGEMRSLALHCHWIEGSFHIRRHVIRGAVRAHAICPIWYRLGAAKIDDERLGIDFALNRSWRQAMRPLRAALRSLLDSAAQQFPDDVHLAGQRVRFALDAGDVVGAGAAAAACTGNGTQCGLLRGLVRYAADDVAGADSAFTAAARLMSEADRCAWTDVGVLLETDARRSYALMNCATRADIEARLWWLADPLYLEEGNERYAEHVARKVLNSILAPLGFDGRLHWHPAQGGEAVAEALVRYGWPYQMFWGGVEEDHGHDEWLSKFAADTAPPYVAMEYSRDRLHTVPPFAALRSPFQTVPADWQLNAPAGSDDWWPAEHYARDRSAVAQLPVGQRVMLRRRDATRFVWAGDLSAVELKRAVGDSVRATLFQSRAVSEISRVAVFRGRVGSPLVVDAALRNGTALIGIELPGDRSRAAARTRFGVDIPRPLAALGGAKALSQPLLFDPTLDSGRPIDADAAIRQMFGTTTFRKPERLGVYWEAYGFATADTASIEVLIAREDRPGVFARIAGVFRAGASRNGSLGVRWSEAPGNTGTIQRVEGDVPVQVRSVVLDVSQLMRGTYRLQLSMTGEGVAVVSSERRLVIR